MDPPSVEGLRGDPWRRQIQAKAGSDAGRVTFSAFEQAYAMSGDAPQARGLGGSINVGVAPETLL
jgi:hypothetical protein